ncbi:MAG: DNA gyrase subunit A [Clostridia bacterium]|nr:DNA gyrase subunit A [Clostridia bacterium]
METKENYEFKDQKIVDVQMEKEVKKSFINYAMSVIVSRALPDVRDGLKPVHRRILYAMYEDHLTYDQPFRKSATTVGNVLGRYHPHGDASVYDAMVRLAQDFNLRYTLVEGHGNFGNIDGDQAAAYRYTEARLSKMANEMITDIEKEVVDFSPNFDNKLREPDVLPARFPNLLVNGSMGIAVGMATNIPPHNLGEVIDGTIYLMDHPEAEVADLMQFIKGPDFPTGATICGTAGIIEAYATGRGRIPVRAKAEVQEDKNRIVITEIPYGVNKAMMVEAMANCHKEKKIEGITALRDESGRAGLRVVVEYRRDANGSVILNQLYKYTQLQDTCAVNMLAIVGGVPKVLTLKEVLTHYITHQQEVIVRRVKFDLQKALKEMHIFEGFKIALDNIDKVISIIRASANVSEAKVNLMNAFKPEDLIDKFTELGDYESVGNGLSEAQATAIVEMTLGRLSGMERDKIEDRLAKLAEQVKDLTAILGDPARVNQIIKDDMLEIKRKYGDERRTEIQPMEDEIILEDLIDRHTCVITMTHSGYIKRQNSDAYSAQRRGGKGIIGMTTKEEDFVEQVIAVDTHSHLMLFTNAGKVYTIKAYRIPEAGRTAKGTNIVNLLEMGEDEKITAMISVPNFDENEYLLFVTKNGTVKRTSLAEFAIQRKGGKIALSLDEGDELVYVRHTTGSDHVIIATRDGNAIRFDEQDARPMGRTARGVRGIRLEEGDSVAGVTLVDDTKTLVTITERGFGKRTSFDEFTCHNRGGKGVICHNIGEKTGALAGIATVSEDDDLMLITSTGTMIRVNASDLSRYRRSAAGVIVMRLDEGSYIVNFAKVEKQDDEETAGEEEQA